MARRSLLYFLFSKNKKPYYVDDNGHVVEGNEDYKKPNGQPAHLNNSPEGWKGTLIKYARNIQYWGIFRSYSAPMKFVKDGATILHKLRWTIGVEAICFLGILRLDRTQLPYNYETFYLSEINFAKYKNTERGINIEALEGGLVKLLKSYESTVYEIPIDTDPEHINVLDDGMDLNSSATYFISNGLVTLDNGQHTLEGTKIGGETIGGVTTESFTRRHFTNNADLTANNTPILVTGSSSTKIKIKYKFGFTVSLGIGITPNPVAGGQLLIRSFDFNNVVDSAYILHNYGGASNMYQHHTLENIIEITVPPFRKLYLAHFLTLSGVIASGSGADEVVFWSYDDSEEDIFEMSYNYRHKETYVKGLYPYRVMEKLVEKISNGLYGIKSDWLLAMRDIVITSGDALRGIVTDDSDPTNPIKGAVIKISILDFFKAMNRWGAGLSIEGLKATVDDKLVIEPINYFFPNTVIADLGEVSKPSLYEAEDIICNTIKCGYEKKDYADAMGRYEMNQGQQWTTPITRIVRELNLVSPVRADAIGAELLRINYENKKTSDSSSDNDPFFLNIETELQIDTSVDPNIEYYKLYRPAYTAVSGLLNWETAYNLELTPKKSLLANGALIRSMCDLMDNEKIVMSSADKNSDFSTTLNGVTVLEKEDIQIGSLAAPLFRASYISFTTKLPVNIMALIKANPYGKVRFTVKGREFKGFLFDGGVKVGMEEAQSWIVLSAPENDLLNFNNAA